MVKTKRLLVKGASLGKKTNKIKIVYDGKLSCAFLFLKFNSLK